MQRTADDGAVDAEAFLFDPETHTYTLGGWMLPSVTTVLTAQRILDFSGIPAAVAAQAMARGTALHAAIAHFLQTGARPDTAALAGAVDSWCAAAQALGIRHVHWTERPMVDRVLRYAGTPDVVARLAGVGCEAVIDLKTGRAEPGYALQTAAYAALCVAAGVPITARYLVQVFADGRPGRVTAHEDPHDTDEWRAALYCYQRAAARGER